MDDDRNIARPDIVEAIRDGRQPAAMDLATLTQPFPVAWREQAEAVCGPSSTRRS